MPSANGMADMAKNTPTGSPYSLTVPASSPGNPDRSQFWRDQRRADRRVDPAGTRKPRCQSACQLLTTSARTTAGRRSSAVAKSAKPSTCPTREPPAAICGCSTAWPKESPRRIPTGTCAATPIPATRPLSPGPAHARQRGSGHGDVRGRPVGCATRCGRSRRSQWRSWDGVSAASLPSAKHQFQRRRLAATVPAQDGRRSQAHLPRTNSGRRFRQRGGITGPMKGLNYYVLAKLIWDPECDINSLIDDYCRSGFGCGSLGGAAIFRPRRGAHDPVGEGGVAGGASRADTSLASASVQPGVLPRNDGRAGRLPG